MPIRGDEGGFGLRCGCCGRCIQGISKCCEACFSSCGRCCGSCFKNCCSAIPPHFWPLILSVSAFVFSMSSYSTELLGGDLTPSKLLAGACTLLGGACTGIIVLSETCCCCFHSMNRQQWEKCGKTMYIASVLQLFTLALLLSEGMAVSPLGEVGLAAVVAWAGAGFMAIRYAKSDSYDSRGQTMTALKPVTTGATTTYQGSPIHAMKV